MLKASLEKLINRENLTETEMMTVMDRIMEGEATPAQIGGILTALRVKGETVDEITGAARVMRQKALKVKFEAPAVIDTCGTGGDGANTFNISTTAAFIVAAAGLPVAKHGNRAMSSKCGSADLLEALGIKVDLPPEKIETCLKEAGIGFMFAPVFHQSMKHAVAPRRELGFRTIFNMLGPLTNPAAANYQLIGVYKAELTETLAEVLCRLGARRVMVVHGAGGLDELSLDGPNKVSFLDDGEVKTFTFRAEEVGLTAASNQLLKGTTAAENAELTLRILNGTEQGPPRDVVVLNAAAALLVAGYVPDLPAGVVLAAQLIDNGSAYRKLEHLRRMAV
ncbi:MAG TPA: anthranilate phosphoribosyltransferase [Bacillota bacterium]|nr:anthranilate phosphoribosyltransferase [Bacillota bacterium]